MKPNKYENKYPQNIRFFLFNWIIFEITRPADLKQLL